MLPNRAHLTATAAALALASCGIKPSDTEFAAVASEVFEQLDASDYESIYREASRAFTSAPHDLEAFERDMAFNAEKLGRCGPPSPREKPTTILTHYGVVTYQDFLRSCANGIVDMQVSTVQRQGQPRLIGLHAYGDALAEADPLAGRPDWISQADLDLLEKLGVNPRADLEVRASFHWRWRAHIAFTAGAWRCPSASTIDISRTINVITAPPGAACETATQARAEMLKLALDGTAAPLGE